jgi:toxin CcdB
MAQFDVYRPPPSNRVAYLLFVVDIQSDLLQGLDTRQVAPLVDVGQVGGAVIGALTPRFRVDGRNVLLYAHQMFAVPRLLLKAPVASLAHRRNDIIRAVDALLAGV